MKRNTMKSEKAASQLRQMASYFGLTVEVLLKMQHYSLVDYDGREFVVNSEDLKACQAVRAAA
jgi:hypothetical protein